MEPPLKRKREQETAPAASTSTQTIKKPLSDLSWSSILTGIQGQRGEPGAIEALSHLCRVINSQRATGASKKSANDPAYKVWTDFLSHWQKDPGLKDIVACWERGDQAGNNNLTISSLHVYANLLNVACSPAAGLIALDSPYQSTLASLIQELLPLLHYFQKYLNLPGKNDLATASLEVISALLKLVRHGSARNATNRKIWEALNLDARAICRLLGTKRKTPLVNKHGRKPDIRHLMFNVLNNLLGPSSSLSMKVDILNQKGVISAIFKGLSEDPSEVVEAVLESMARLAALSRLPLDIRCRIAEDSWTEVLKLYARSGEERTPQDDPDTPVFPPAVTAHRYLLFVVSCLSAAGTSLAPIQRKALGGLVGLLQLSDSLEQTEVAVHILQAAPDLLPSFWAKFAPSLEPRLSSKWVTSVAFATQVVSSPLPDALTSRLYQAKQTDGERPAVPNMASLLDTALMPPSIGKTWISKALQQSDTVPLVTYMTCQFLHAGMQKCAAILDCMHETARSLAARGDSSGAEAWRSAALKLASEASDRLPDLQVLIALVQKSLGRAFSRASSVASINTASGSVEGEGGSADEDNTLMTSLALRAIYLYRRIAPSVFSKLRFDFGKLLSSPFFASVAEGIAPLAAVGQSALLQIISLPADTETGEGAVSWAWSKSSDGGLSPVASIMRIYLSSSVSSLSDAAEKAVAGLLGSSLLFEHDPSEIPIWLIALPKEEPEQINVLVFFDGCLQRCLQTPYKYVDQMAEILSNNDPACSNTACRQASPLLATLLEQTLYRLTREDTAKPYLVFLQHLLTSLTCHLKCRCLLTSMTQKLVSDINSTKGQDEAKASFAVYQRLVAILLGKQKSGPQKTNPEGLTTLERLLSLAGTDEFASQMSSALSSTTSAHQAQVARLAGYLVLNGRDVTEGLKALSTSTHAGALKALLELPQLPALFNSQSSQDTARITLLSSLLEQYGRVAKGDQIIRPYVDVLAEAADAKTVMKCGSIIRAFKPSQSLGLLTRLLNGSRDLSSIACISLLCDNMSTRALDTTTHSAITNIAAQLFDCSQASCDALLATWAEQVLPPGFFSMATSEKSVSPKERTLAMPIITSLAKRTIKEGVRSAGSARILAVALYLSSAVWQEYSESSPSLSLEPDSSAACLAFLEVGAYKANGGFTSTSLETMVEPAVTAVFKHEGHFLQERAGKILVSIVRMEPRLVSTVLARMQTMLVQEGQGDPLRLTGGNALLLEALHSTIGTAESFAVLEGFMNTCLLWLVRRYAEDESNDESTAHLTTALSTCLQKNHKKWLLKPHLVEPVVTAALQNRLNDPVCLLFSADLITECKLQDGVYVKQIQSLLADRRLRLSLQPSSSAREALVVLLRAYDARSPGLFGQLNAIPALLPFYQATLSKSDRGLLHIFRRTELYGRITFRQMFQNWVPWQLRGVCTGSFQVLANLDPAILHKGMCAVLKSRPSENETQSGAADPLFYLGFVSALLEEENISRQNWLGLISSNAMGLAICSLASPHKHFAIAGDKILARARNSLQSSEVREKDEILFLLDAVRNAIEPSRRTSVPGLPALMALFLADALHGISTPESSLYPASWRWLLSRSVIDTEEVPLFYNIFYGTSDDRAPELKWLLQTLQEGVQTSEDWRIVRRRQVVELLVTFMQSGVAGSDPSIVAEVLKTIAHLTALPQAVHDLMTRNGFLSTLAMQDYQNQEERQFGVEIIRNCVSLVQPTKLRRARDGLWLADLLRAVSRVWTKDVSDDAVLMICDILRRSAAHLVSGSSEAQEIVTASLVSHLEVVVKVVTERAALSKTSAPLDLYDAIVRLGAAIPGELFESATCLAIQAGVKGVREELIRAWQM